MKCQGCEALSRGGLGARQPWGQAPFQLDSSALFHSALDSSLVWSALLCSALPAPLCSGQVRCLWYFIFGVSAPAKENSLQSLVEEKVQSLSHRGADLSRLKSLFLVPYCFVLMQMRTSNSHSLIGLKITLLIGQNGVVLIGKNVDGDIGMLLQLYGESLSPIGWNTIPL